MPYLARSLVLGALTCREYCNDECALRKMAAIVLTFFILTSIQGFRVAESELESYSDSGWRPISNDKVFSDYWNSKITTAGWLHSSTNHDYIKVVDAPNINNELMVSNNENSPENFINKNQESNIVLPMNEIVAFKNTQVQHSNDIPFRRGKKIELKSINNLNKSFKEENDNLINENGEREIIKDKTYKVTEDTDDEAEDLLRSDQSIFVAKNIKDVYKEDNRGNNYTNSLWKILSNYNIRTGDILPNYALSLRHNSRNSNSGGYVYMRVPIRIPTKHNSANHASVDPLLAVFLSNYGHYLPGVFGFQHNYKNLYGYLASNNIHNNKPFGAYKIFADTDSSL